MATQNVESQFVTGLKRRIFHNVWLLGSWDPDGRYSDEWAMKPMRETIGEDGCPLFTATHCIDLETLARRSDGA